MTINESQVQTIQSKYTIDDNMHLRNMMISCDEPSTRSWAIPDRQADGVDSILYMGMVGTLQLQSPECVSEVLSMREREVANLGSDGVLVLLIRLGLAN